MNLPDIKPKTLLIYYGWPSGINRAGNFVDLAAQEFARYDYIVIGGAQAVGEPTLEENGHGDHGRSGDIIKHPLMQNTTTFIYLDLGVQSPPNRDPVNNYSLPIIRNKINKIKTMGADGVFFDGAGNDFQVDDLRRSSAVEMAHDEGLRVVINAGDPNDVFDNNPILLRCDDFYLWETYHITETGFQAQTDWQPKFSDLERHKSRSSFGVMSVTSEKLTAFNQAKFEYAWCFSLLHEHEAFAWAEFRFSATGGSANSAPFHIRPPFPEGVTWWTSNIVDNVIDIFRRSYSVAKDLQVTRRVLWINIDKHKCKNSDISEGPILLIKTIVTMTLAIFDSLIKNVRIQWNRMVEGLKSLLRRR